MLTFPIITTSCTTRTSFRVFLVSRRSPMPPLTAVAWHTPHACAATCTRASATANKPRRLSTRLRCGRSHVVALQQRTPIDRPALPTPNGTQEWQSPIRLLGVCQCLVSSPRPPELRIGACAAAVFSTTVLCRDHSMGNYCNALDAHCPAACAGAALSGLYHACPLS
jgi:hypothetical protein